MRKPDFESANVKAWRVPQSPDATCLASWLVHQPGVHAFWSWWYVSLIHMRDVDGLPPAVKRFPTASHEFLAVALNPEAPEPDPDSQGPFPYLTPADQEQQFEVASDQQAIRVVEQAIRAVCIGASFDSDWRSFWANELPQMAAAERKKN